MDDASAPVEIELKFLVEDEARLSAVEAAVVAGGAKLLGRAQQLNRFFDTPAGTLRAAGVTLRLREEEGRVILAAKGPRRRLAGQGEDLHVRAEVEATVPGDVAGAIRDGSRSILAVLRESRGDEAFLGEIQALVGELPLAEFGAFGNRRARYGPLPFGDGSAILEVDRTSFPGGRTDHEVELEVPASEVEAARSYLEDVFRACGVEPRTATSKAQRFARALESP